MLSNYLKIALRNLWKTKGITAINVTGLSVGLACFGLVGLFVLDERTFDRFHPKADQLYRVVQNSFKEDGSIEEGHTFHPMPLGEALKTDFPEVVNTMRVRGLGNNFVRSARLTTKEESIKYADPSIFEMFHFPLLYGNPGEALKEINSVVLSEAMAMKYFDEKNPVGRTLEIQIDGRNFDPAVVADSTISVIINEAMANDFGWADPIGQVLTNYNEKKPALNPVAIGVVQDFNFQSFHSDVKPMMFIPNAQREIERILVRVRGGENAKAIALLQANWAKTVTELPFRYSYLEEDMNQFYKMEERWGSIVGIAGSIAIILACLGLFGLTALAVVNRMKEIGIRKVLGASVAGITGLIAKDFLKLVAIAIVISSPVAWYLMHRWLADFAYRIDVQWWIFAVAGIAAVAIALITVSFQSIRAALVNPVKSLRNE